MNSLVSAREFFKGQTPAFLPGDIPVPNWGSLCRRTSKLSVTYPVEALRTVLREGNSRIGASPESLARIEAISEHTVFVVAGQQAGLFGGPLYTIYKTLHAVRLAERLTEQTGRDVLPIFWIASDDHDFDEVSKLGIRSANGEDTTVTYRPETYRDGMPVGDIVLDGRISAAVDTLIASMPGGDRRDLYEEILRKTWKPNVLWTDAFAQEMVALTGETGLIMLDPRWRGFKELCVPVMMQEIQGPLKSTKLINASADDFDTAKERKKGLRKNDTTTNLFVEIDGIRAPLRYENGTFKALDNVYDANEITGLLTSDPGLFSPAAGLRPVCQDAVMPVAAMIAGPGERRYLGQLSDVYSHFDVNPSIVWPRASFTLVERRIVRTAEKEDVPLQRMFEPLDQLTAGLAEDSFPKEASDAFDALRAGITDGMSRLSAPLEAIDPTLVPATDKEQGRLLHTLNGLLDKAMRAHKRTVSISRERFAIANSLLRPNGIPQERWFGVDLLLSLTGPDGIAEFKDLTSPGEENHRIMVS